MMTKLDASRHIKLNSVEFNALDKPIKDKIDLLVESVEKLNCKINELIPRYST